MRSASAVADFCNALAVAILRSLRADGVSRRCESPVNVAYSSGQATAAKLLFPRRQDDSPRAVARAQCRAFGESLRHSSFAGT
jgi:hypothetical protein